MKLLCFLFLCSMAFCLPLKNKPLRVEPEISVPVAPVTIDSVNFTSQIQPILQSRCNPCHFPGGKMYEKMPFDQAATIVGHPEGVLKRIKDKKESALFRQFFAQSGK